MAVTQRSRDILSNMSRTFSLPGNDLSNGSPLHEDTSATTPLSSVGSEALSSRNGELKNLCALFAIIEG
jgi:hypothetical protein